MTTKSSQTRYKPRGRLRWPSGFTWLIIAFAATAILFLVVGGWLTAVRHGTPEAEIGSGLLALGAAFAAGGVATGILHAFDRSQRTRATWMGLLAELIRVDHAVESARRLIKAHKTVSMYDEQIRVLIDTTFRVRLIWWDPLIRNDRQVEKDGMTLANALGEVWTYLECLTREYEERYLVVARQQRIDELRLDEWFNNIAKEDPDARSPHPGDAIDHAYPPAMAWQELSEFRRLKLFIGNEFKYSDFVQALNKIKPMLEARAGIERRREEYDPPRG